MENNSRPSQEPLQGEPITPIPPTERPLEAPTDLPRGFRIMSGDLYPSPFSSGDIIMINTQRVLQRRSMRRIPRDGRK